MKGALQLVQLTNWEKFSDNNAGKKNTDRAQLFP